MPYVVGGDSRGEFKYGIESALTVDCTYSAIMTIGSLSKPEQFSRSQQMVTISMRYPRARASS